MNDTIKAGLILFGALVLSRLLPLPANSEPLLGLAVLIPYLTKSNLGFLMMPAVMFVSAIAPFISKALPNKYISLLASWLVWHVMANAGQWYPPFSPEALLFDIRFLLSGLSVVVLYDIGQRVWQTASTEA